MTFRDPSKPMWVHALKMLEQADRLQKQFFQLRQSSQSGPMWEPPVDIFETKDELLIWVALPGVDPGNISVIVDNDALAIVGERPLAAKTSAIIRRLEIPHGRFERRINLKGGHFEIRENILTNGCLKLVLRKI
jgi:HSP20 family molecular chaperone IbpA